VRLYEELKQKALAKLPEPPTPRFNFRVGWASSYDTLFEDRVEISGEDSLLTSVISLGRVLLCGRGGSAKTVMLNRLVSIAVERGFLPIKIDLKLWSGKDVERWNSSEADNTSRFAQLLESASIGLTLPLFASLPPNGIKVVLVDGLNELQSGIGEQIIQVLDSAVTDQLGTRVLVSDRLVRRDLRAPHRWKLATILPLTEDEIRQILTEINLVQRYEAAGTDQRALWSSPFFLDAFLKGGDTGEDRSSTFASFFAKVPLTPAEFESLSEAAFELYRKHESRTFLTQELRGLISPDILQRLNDAGVLKHEGNKAYFTHHLTHDYLAASYLKRVPEKWNQPNFDVISFSASSFDSLAMVLEQIDSTELAEKFVRELFDWNPYAAAYCLAEQKTRRMLSEEMRAVVLSMMAERKFDLIDATARRATDALHLSSGKLAKALVAAARLEDVFVAVQRVPSNQEWFRNWRTLFSMPRTSTVELNTVRQLQSKDSVIGWTVSNVLKRTVVGKEQLSFVKSLTPNRTPVVRWRAVHVLGAVPSVSNARLLAGIIDRDGNQWVRFGAVRSLVEMAANGDGHLRKTVFALIRSRLKKIVSDQRSRRELESVLLISKVKRRTDWVEYVSELLRELYDEDMDSGANERFERIARKFREIYA